MMTYAKITALQLECSLKQVITKSLIIIEVNNESHGNNDHGIFCVTGKDSDYIDMDDIY